MHVSSRDGWVWYKTDDRGIAVRYLEEKRFFSPPKRPYWLLISASLLYGGCHTIYSLGCISRIGVHRKLIEAKAFPLLAWTGPYGFRRLMLPDFLDNRQMKVARLAAVLTGCLYPPGHIAGTQFCYTLSQSLDRMWPEGLSQWKIQITSKENRNRGLSGL